MGHTAGYVSLRLSHGLEGKLADKSLPKSYTYLHPGRSKQFNPPDAAQAGLYTHLFPVLIGCPLAPYVMGHTAGYVSLRLSHGLEGKLADKSLPKSYTYLHPVCSKQFNPPDAAQAGLYTHLFPVLIGCPLAPYVMGHTAGYVSLRLSHGL